MSHPSKVQFFAKVHDCGYRTYLYFVATESPQLNIDRIRARLALGGHDVPDERILRRYHSSLSQAPAAASHADRAYFFDNSGREPVLVGELLPDRTLSLQLPQDRLPRWFSTTFLNS